MKNRYKILEDGLGKYVEIEMIRRDGEVFYTMVDFLDLQKIQNFKYSLHAGLSTSNGDFYAQFCQYLGQDDEKRSKHRTILLQRFLTDTIA